MNKDNLAGNLIKYGILVQIPGAILFIFSNSPILLTITGLTIVISFILLEWAVLIFLRENIKLQDKEKISIKDMPKLILYTWAAVILSFMFSGIGFFFKLIYEQTT